MTRKHFKELAELLGFYDVNGEFLRSMISFCYKQNRNFDENRFRDAVEAARKKFNSEVRRAI